MVLLNLVRFSICFVLIAIPTAFMGATLPVLVKRFAEGGNSLGRQVGFLYGLNTAGAVLGCVATGFLLLRTLGMKKTTVVAVAINIGVGLLALLLARGERAEAATQPVSEPAKREEGDPGLYDLWTVRMVLLAIGISGFCALAYEVLWARMLNLFLQNNFYSFTLVIATFLLGIAIGSLLYSNLLSRIGNRIALFVVLEVGIGLYAYATPFIFDWFNKNLFLVESDALTLAKTAVTMIVPTVLMGIAVPLAMQICQRGPRQEGSSVGTVYAVNTMGSILGAFVAGFILIPTIGLHLGLILVASLNVVAGLLAVLPTKSRRGKLVWTGAVALGIALMFGLAPPNLFRVLYEKAKPTADILHYEEGKIANVVVYDFFMTGYKDLFLNRAEEASTRLWHVQLFKMLGVLPVMAHEDPDDALMVAFGAGMAAGACTQNVTSLDCVDLNPDIHGVAEVFTEENLDVVNNPKFNQLVNDGRNALLLSPQQYSVIISDATNPLMFDSWTLYTEEFHELVKSRLKPGGVFGQWTLIPLKGDSVKVILKTFQEVFPHASFWCIYGSSQCIMLGTPERLELDYLELKERLEPAIARSELDKYGIEDTEKFLSYLLLGEDEIREALADFPKISTDDLPHAQFQTEGQFEGVQASLDLLQHQASPLKYMTNLGPDEGQIENEMDALQSIARRLTLGYLINDKTEFYEAAAVAEAVGREDDQNVAFMLGHDQNRRRYFEQRIANHPEDANAHNNLGHTYRLSGRYDEAIDHFEEAIALKSDFANAHANLALAYVDVARYDEAVAKLFELESLNPAKIVLRTVENQLRKIRSLRKLDYEGPSSDAYLSLARAHRGEGDMVAATRAAQKAAELSGDPEALLQVAGLYENHEFLEEAIANYKPVSERVPGDPRLEEKIRQLRHVQRDRSAFQDWLNSNKISLRREGDPGNHPTSCLTADEVWNEYEIDGKVDPNNLREAAALFEISAEQKPDDMHVYRDLAELYEHLEEYEEAALTYRRALESAPSDLYFTGSLQRMELMETLNQRELGGEEGARGLHRLGRVYQSLGAFERAAVVLEEAVEEAPEDPEIRLSLATALEGSSQLDKALEAYADASRLENDAVRSEAIERRATQIRSILEAAEEEVQTKEHSS